MPTKEEVGSRVRMARFRRNMTLKEVAQRSGMSATHISEIERGKTSPTIGALQRIAAALYERSAHFVEERDTPLAVLTKRRERADVFFCDVEGQVHGTQRVNDDPPWATLRLFRSTSSPGERAERAPQAGEVVILTLRGMIRVTVGNESHVMREGDTIQFPLENGYTIETLGEEESEALGIGAYPARSAW